MATLSKPSISVIVPVHRNSDLIRDAVGRIHTFLADKFEDFEIILIDSGIGDAPALCDSMKDSYDRVRIIHDTLHTQFGAKLKIGYREARKDLVWLIPLDLPFELDYGLKAISLFERYDCVFSYRPSDSRGLWRRIQTRVYNLLTQHLLGLKVRSVNSQFRMFKREVVQRLRPLSDGWFIDAEVLYYVTKLAIPYIEIPIPVVERSHIKSSVKTFAFVGIVKEALYFCKHNRHI